MIAEIYVDEVLDPHVNLLRCAIGSIFLLTHDNERAQSAAQVTVYAVGEEIQWMEWPTYSPDLYPIEQAYDAVLHHCRLSLTPQELQGYYSS
ncbi:hypothetical protein AVEN_188800-1 [Araneus ventricosus]|uniref:Tc1-like transposase DDE domain-containing protein n=1 Tax=Araneus ventricosus TaxID=182803 RepID=A0A4Y2BTK5_ARAVE|nr:hypothetical protein AVEN_188800-1 [Araneus ventricosus]